MQELQGDKCALLASRAAGVKPQLLKHQIHSPPEVTDMVISTSACPSSIHQYRAHTSLFSVSDWCQDGALLSSLDVTTTSPSSLPLSLGRFTSFLLL
jgi:hypothetical protein